ncbi:uncharacterized protein I303_101734 [Kwoniella dejecticola CBS 10117]|uniref:Protein YOP1 n=1 Tax=Kwoniella dejecticola CBS 10117 TaxID=1296121 RepID=A0A1A6ACY3_9TREE|nr:uncharacterized protein I303_02130 [Kwoniella dejecticola CBS 10117]OBR87915.1 hypothetical protein I303_02130 [Kwoniella dejecticola CBS 10117]
MDPTTSAHVDSADLTAKRPEVHETSGLTTSTVPSSAPHLGAPSEGFNNPFSTNNTTSAASSGSAPVAPVAPVNPIKQNYPDTQVYEDTHPNTQTQGGQSDFADIHARSNLSSTTSDKDKPTTGVTAGDRSSKATTQAQTKASQVSAQAQQKANEAATGIRQRVRKLSVDLNHAADHPAVKNVKGTANNYIARFREQLGRSPTVADLERRTGVDRVILVVGGVLGYILLIPLNVLRLALPITDLLTILPATYLAALALDKPETTANDQKVKSLLSFFVVLGLIQTLESLMAGVLERRIPQYFTVKLLFLAYLLHPRTQGATQVHERIFRPLLASAQQSSRKAPSSSSTSTSSQSTYSGPRPTSKVSTPPTSKESLSSASSPQTSSSGYTTMAASIPLPGENDNLTKADARGQGYSVVSEVPNF